MILPALERNDLYEQVNFDVSVDSPANQTAARRAVGSYLCMSDPNRRMPLTRDDKDYARANYVANFGSGDLAVAPGDGGGVFARNYGARFDEVGDGLSQTLCVSERHSAMGWDTSAGWFGGGRLPCGCPMITTRGTLTVEARLEACWIGVTPTVTSQFDNSDPQFHISDDHARMVLFQPREIPAPNHDLLTTDAASSHANAVNFLFCDGSVRALGSGMEWSVLQGLGTRSGGETASQ